MLLVADGQLQWNDCSQANSVAGFHVLKMIFHQIWGMVGFKEWLGGFPTTFVFDQNEKMGDSCESWAETGLLAYSCTSIYTFLTFLQSKIYENYNDIS